MCSDTTGKEEKMSDNITGQGMLYLCATPIGNLEDITFRVIRTLKEVDLIAAEDTRNSIKLLNHFEIKTSMTSYHEHNKVEKAKVLVDKMRAGTNIALITDAGTPGISDPGEELVRQCHEAGIQVTSLPGAAACITALTMSGQPTRRFVFEAFLPFDKKERADVLEELKNETRTIIIHEAPHHLAALIDELTGVLGGDRSVSICKELTKRYEKVWKTTLEEASQFYKSQQPRGEYVLVIAGRDRQELKLEKQKSWDAMSIQEHVAMYENQGIDRKEAMRMAAKDRGISKRDVYQQLLS